MGTNEWCASNLKSHILDKKIVEIAQQGKEMKRFHRQMSNYRDQCAQAIDQGSRCPVIADVSDEKA